MTLLQCAAYNWAGLVTLRVFMGAFEAGFFAGELQSYIQVPVPRF
jgi:hypothetical protein